MQRVPQLLHAAADIYEERNKVYGDNYKRFGQIMVHLFPKGLKLSSIEDHNRFCLFVQIIAKQTRYAAQFENGGHPDSLDDTCVYSMMLRELDLEKGQPELPIDGAAEVDRMRGKPNRQR